MFHKNDMSFKGHFGSSVFEVKEVSNTGEFEGYGSVFNVWDENKDMVVPGAFLKSLQDRPANRVKMLWQHHPSEPIGVWSEMSEDSYGLRCKGRLLTSTVRGKEAHDLMMAGAIDGLSIGYRTLRADNNHETGERKLLELELWEVSVVTFPMNRRSIINQVKSGQLPTEREFENWLTRDAGFSSQQAKAIIANGFKALGTERDAGNGDGNGAAVRSAFNEALAALRQK